MTVPLEERVCFGNGIPEAVNVLLQRAAAHALDFRASERALLDARRLAPLQLEVLVALYKLYFYRGRTAQAQTVVLDALRGAARAGGFDPDWRVLTPASADWQADAGPPRIYLYSLKALAFIRLRLEDHAGASAVLTVLGRLDPDDRVGAGVIRDLAAALEAA